MQFWTRLTDISSYCYAFCVEMSNQCSPQSLGKLGIQLAAGKAANIVSLEHTHESVEALGLHHPIVAMAIGKSSLEAQFEPEPRTARATTSTFAPAGSSFTP